MCFRCKWRGTKSKKSRFCAIIYSSLVLQIWTRRRSASGKPMRGPERCFKTDVQSGGTGVTGPIFNYRARKTRESIWKHNLLSLTVLYSLACHGFEPVVLTSLSTHCICDVCPELQVYANFIQGYGGDRRENFPLYRPVFPRAACTVQSMY